MAQTVIVRDLLCMRLVYGWQLELSIYGFLTDSYVRGSQISNVEAHTWQNFITITRELLSHVKKDLKKKKTDSAASQKLSWSSLVQYTRADGLTCRVSLMTIDKQFW